MVTQQIVDGPQRVGSQMLWLALKTCVTDREMWAQDFDRTGINIVRSDQNIENPHFFENYHFLKRYNSTFPGYFGSPPGTRAIVKDPGNERFRMRCDSRKKITYKKSKNKKLEHSYEKAKYYFSRIKISKIHIFGKNITFFNNKINISRIFWVPS